MVMLSYQLYLDGGTKGRCGTRESLPLVSEHSVAGLVRPVFVIGGAWVGKRWLCTCIFCTTLVPLLPDTFFTAQASVPPPSPPFTTYAKTGETLTGCMASVSHPRLTPTHFTTCSKAGGTLTSLHDLSCPPLRCCRGFRPAGALSLFLCWCATRQATKEWKFSVVEAVMQCRDRGVLGQEALDSFRTILQQGPFWVPSKTRDVATLE